MNLTSFIEDLLASEDLRPETRRSYGSAIRCHIAPDIGQRNLEEITAADMRAFFGRLRAAGVGSGSLLTVRKLLNKAYRVALLDGIVDRNPVTSVKLPRRSTSNIDPPTAAEVEAIANAIGPRYRALVLVLAWTGLRIGEAAGLRLVDWDADRRRFLVRQQSTRYGMADLKTDAARRVVPVPAFVADAVAAHLAAHPTDDLIFTTRTGRAVTATGFYSNFRRACERAGVRAFHPHELRHHAVSAMARSGAPIKAVQTVVGHASAKMTLEVYSHVTDQDLQDIADRLDEAAS